MSAEDDGLKSEISCPWRRAAGLVLGAVVRLWLLTLRVRVRTHPLLVQPGAGEQPWVIAFQHGKQWPLLAWKRRRETVVMVSLSPDGELQSGVLRSLGLRVVRGSASRKASRALATMIREMRRGLYDAAFAVDGPKGPRGVAKGGAPLAARATGGVVVPAGTAMASGLVVRKAWDRFELAWPFARVAVVLGAPLVVGDESDSNTTLSLAIESANREAQTLLEREAGDKLASVQPGENGANDYDA